MLHPWARHLQGTETGLAIAGVLARSLMQRLPFLAQRQQEAERRIVAVSIPDRSRRGPDRSGGQRARVKWQVSLRWPRCLWVPQRPHPRRGKRLPTQRFALRLRQIPLHSRRLRRVTHLHRGRQGQRQPHHQGSRMKVLVCGSMTESRRQRRWLRGIRTQRATTSSA